MVLCRSFGATFTAYWNASFGFCLISELGAGLKTTDYLCSSNTMTVSSREGVFFIVVLVSMSFCLWTCGIASDLYKLRRQSSHQSTRLFMLLYRSLQQCFKSTTGREFLASRRPLNNILAAMVKVSINRWNIAIARYIIAQACQLRRSTLWYALCKWILQKSIIRSVHALARMDKRGMRLNATNCFCSETAEQGLETASRVISRSVFIEVSYFITRKNQPRTIYALKVNAYMPIYHP